MRKKLSFEKHVVTALACAHLLGCVGEIKKGIAGDATTTQAGPIQDSDASSVSPNTDPPASRGDAMAQAETGTSMSTPDGRVATRPPEAGTGTQATDARMPPGQPTSSNDAQAPVDSGPGPSTKRTPVFVAVGYLGVRMVSRDLGKTWVSVTSSTGAPADDDNLLRAVAIANGLIVTGGWKVWTSTDGSKWDLRDNPTQVWWGGVKYGNNLFVAAGGNGSSCYSSDGLSWTSGNVINPNYTHARSVAFGNGMFVAGTDTTAWYSTANGKDWTQVSGSHTSNNVVWCSDHFSDSSACSEILARNDGRTALGENVYVSSDGQKLERSENGKDWTMVADTSKNPIEGVAFGYLNN